MRMLRSISRSIALYRAGRRVRPDTGEAVIANGHRQFVGGLWEEIGRLQFDFLVQHGLRPDHVLLDIGCGAFRGGRFLIAYLEPGNYLGIDKHRELIERGRAEEIDEELWLSKRPEVIVSDSFDFGGFSKRPDIALAQSVFTHLRPADIRRCLSRLAGFAQARCQLYATFFETDVPVLFHHRRSHSHRGFWYTRRQMARFGERCGWGAEYIGAWNHPRGQMMMRFSRR